MKILQLVPKVPTSGSDSEIEASVILSGHVHQPSSLWGRWRDSLALVPGHDETSAIPA